ncbi:hypothetical protein ACWGE0_31575 [Lentzea sp. NPDC054927]
MRRLRTALAVLCSVLMIASCSVYSDDEIGDGSAPEAGENGLPELPDDQRGNDRPPVGLIGFQPPLLPITFKLTTDGKFAISVGGQFVTPFGVIKIGIGQELASVRGADDRVLPTPPADVTELIICQEGPPPSPCQGYTIRSGRKLRVDINGKVVQHIETDRQVIEVAPGTTINVTDDGASTKTGMPGPARIAIEEFKFHETSKDSEVDLERSHSGTRNDLSYDHITGDLRTVNGAKVSRISHHGVDNWWDNLETTDLPGEKECRESQDWRDGFAANDFADDVTVACVKTAEGDLGYLAIGVVAEKKPVAYRIYAYTWVR